MKNYRSRVCKGALLALLTIGAMQAQQVNFDELFPESAFTKVLNTCMQAYGNLELIKEYQGKHNDQQFVTDLAVGRLVRLQEAVEQLLRDKKNISVEDMNYLLRVMQEMHIRIRGLVATKALHAKSTLSLLLNNAQKKLEKWINQY